jgi:hypothetical protein
MRLAIDASKAGIKVLIIDVEGEWKNIIPSLNGKTEYYAAEKNLKINPFELGDKGLVRLILKETLFRGIETEYQELSPQMNYVLDKCIFASESIPDLIDKVVEFEEAELPFRLSNLDKTKTALLVRLGPFRSNQALKEVFHCASSSPDLGRLDDRNIVFDLHELERLVAYKDEVRMIYNTIVTAVLREALSRPQSDLTSNLLVADEAQLLAPRIVRKLLSTDTWATTEFATRLRKRGQSLAIISQSLLNIEEDIRKNCQNNFIFRLQSAEDIKAVAGMLGYTTYRSLDYFTSYISNLRRRQSIVKSPLEDDPFFLTTGEIGLVPISRNQLLQFIPKTSGDSTEAEAEFLESLNSSPFQGAAQRRASLGWDEQLYAKTVGRLIERGVVDAVNVPMGRGRPILLYQMKGAKPSVKHQYYVHWILDCLARRGLVCRVESIGPDIQIPSVRTAINVELGKSYLERNIETALSGFDRVVVCSDRKDVLARLSEHVSSNGGKQVLFSLVWEVPQLFGVDAI